MEERLKKLGERIKHLRKRQGLTQELLAQKAGLHYTYIGGVERGERNPSLRSMEKIARALGVNLKDLFFFPQVLSVKERSIQEIVDILKALPPRDVKLIKRVVEILKEE